MLTYADILQREAEALRLKYGYSYRQDVNNWFILLVTKNGSIEQGLQVLSLLALLVQKYKY
jgi:hypothetical protein